MSEAAAAMAAAASPANGTPGKGDQAKKKSDKVSMVNVASTGRIEVPEMDIFYNNRNPGNGSKLSVFIGHANPLNFLFFNCGKILLP